MDFFLVMFSLLSLFAASSVFHVPIMLLHLVVGLVFACQLVRTQPLCAFTLAIYAAMYFPNPLLVMVGVVPYESHDWELFYFTNALMMIGYSLFIVGAKRLRFIPWDINRLPLMHLRHGRVEFCIYLCLALSALGLAVVIATGAARGVDVFAVHRTYRAVGQQGLSFMFVHYATIALPLGVLLIAFKPVRMQLPYLVAVIVILLIHFMIIRVRTLPIATMLAYGIGTVARHHFVALGQQVPRGRIPPVWRMIVLVGIPLLVLTGVSIRYLRASYQMDDWAVTSERVERLIDQTFVGGDMGYAYHSREAINLFPHAYPYLWGESYYRVLFAPIPRAIWPNKPVSINRLYVAVADRDFRSRGGTRPPGMVATLYVNFGPFGVVGMLIFGWVFAQERYRTFFSLLVLSGMGIWLFKFIRGEPSGPVIELAFIMFYSYWINKFIGPTYYLWPAARLDVVPQANAPAGLHGVAGTHA